MKKLLVVATLSIAVAAVIKKYRMNSFTVPVRITNKEELNNLLNDVYVSFEKLNEFEPKLERVSDY